VRVSARVRVNARVRVEGWVCEDGSRELEWRTKVLELECENASDDESPNLTFFFDWNPHLGMNKFTAFDGTFIKALCNLKSLHLASCVVTAFPDLTTHTELIQISLPDNNLNDFFASNPDYRFPPNLESINLSANQLTITPHLANTLTSITTVNFSFIYLSSFDLL
jgi:hypothetical protein